MVCNSYLDLLYERLAAGTFPSGATEFPWAMTDATSDSMITRVKIIVMDFLITGRLFIFFLLYYYFRKIFRTPGG
jgi:hypothetical protein